MSRRKGFSLVELLIVLAVIAALIATITPVALNAIQKAKATQVAQNLKTLASAFENKLYVDGSAPSALVDLGRDIDVKRYGVAWEEGSGTYTVVVWALEQVKDTTLQSVLSDAKYSSTAEWSSNTVGTIKTLSGMSNLTKAFTPSSSGISGKGIAYYTFTFVVY